MTDAATPQKEPPEDNTTKQVLRQIEYYFSDFMLPATDTKLASLIAADNDSWVPLDIITRYTRMAELAAQLVDFGPAVFLAFGSMRAASLSTTRSSLVA